MPEPATSTERRTGTSFPDIPWLIVRGLGGNCPVEGEGTIHAIPELKGNLAGIDLSHEAAVGKIAEEEVGYLMARGLTRDEATATIVRGFLRVDIEGLPPLLSAELKKAVEESEKADPNVAIKDKKTNPNEAS